jgi:putative FmdB family regulatory protein
MPTYEYECTKCGHQFEKFQSMRDEPLRKCPKCKKAALKRLVGGGAGLIFKGSGFYITDYRKKPAGKAEGGEAKPSAESKAGSEAKSASEAKSGGDSKPGGSPAPAPSKPAAAPAAGTQK